MTKEANYAIMSKHYNWPRAMQDLGEMAVLSRPLGLRYISVTV